MASVDCANLAGFIAQKCVVSYFGDRVLINCHCEEHYVFLVQQRKNIQEALGFIVNTFYSCAKWVTIAIIGTELRQSFPVETQVKQMQMITPNSDLIAECLSYEGACGIVRMSDHKGLFSNEMIAFSSKAHPNDWIGKNMSDYWFEEELSNYTKRLTQDKELRDYSYVAKMMNGEVAQLTVNARLIQWRGEAARIVKTISRELLT